MTDFSPAQMQEMAKMLRHDPIDDYELVAADMLEQAASQTTEIERLTKENEMQRYTLLALNRGDVREVIDVRGKWVSADECLAREIELLERAEALESRLLALREQVEGLPVACVVGVKNGERIEMLKRADVRALFDPAPAPARVRPEEYIRPGQDDDIEDRR